MRPLYRIVANDKDITTLIADRLLVLRTSDRPGMETDEFELRLDDRDGAVSLPSRGSQIEIHLGWEGQKLTLVNRYAVDEIIASGPPDTLVIKGKAADMRGSGRTVRNGAWEGVPLAKIVADIAARNGWQPVCPVSVIVPRVDQLGESDFNFLTRVARLYDCTAKVAAGKLLVMPRQGGISASGKSVPALTIRRSDVSRWQFRQSDRHSQKAVGTRYHDKKSGDLVTVLLENPDAADGLPAVHHDRHIHPNKAAAEAAARARLVAFNRSTAVVRLEMPGRTDVFAEREINAQDFKEGLDGSYLADLVEQVVTQAGWSTTVECNGGIKGKAKPNTKKPLKVEQL